MSVSEMLLEQVVRLYTEAGNRRRDGLSDFDAAVWRNTEELGLPLAMCSEESGGAGLGWTDMFGVIAHSAASGEPSPVGETIVGNALLCSLGLEPGQGPLFFGLPAPAEDGSPVDIPENARLLTGGAAGRIEVATLEEAERTDAPAALQALSAEAGQLNPGAPLLFGALLRCIQISGALKGALDLSVRYASERVQFGRPLSKFQAIQHMLAQLASEAEATAAAARTACAKMDAGDGALAIAIAKVRAGRAVDKGAMLAHQIHGAIGVTLEYPLARLSRNMWRWSEEFGDQRFWAIFVGRSALSMGSAWDTIIAASDPVEGVQHD